MKKITSIVAIAAIAVSFASCKKEYTCVCTVTSGGQSTPTEFPLGKQKKKDAENACSAKVSTVGGSATCSLK